MAQAKRKMGTAKAAAETRRKAAERQRERNASYAARHPERASDERRLRKQQAELKRKHSKRDKLEDGGTPETRAKAARLHQGSMARLFELGHIDANELASSQEIRAAAEQIGRGMGYGTMSMETRVDDGRRGDGAFFEALGAVRAEVAYTSWRQALPDAPIVLTMIVDDLAWRRAAELFHTAPGRAKRLLLDALRAWPDHCRDARDRVSEADLMAAQSGLL